jgi:glycosyltransferase involved in cell wall biosynthesis
VGIVSRIAAHETSTRGPVGHSRTLRVLTLTPFYPSIGDASQGCFVAEPLTRTSGFNISNEVIAVQPFYRTRPRVLQSSVASRWLSYFSLPGKPGLATAGRFLATGIRDAVLASHARKPFDMIHAHAVLPCGHAAAIFGQELKIPFVVSVHGLDVFSTREAGPIFSNWRHRTSAAVYRRAQAVICVSEKVRGQITCDMAARTVVIYNGVDVQLFSPTAAPPPGLSVLSVGNLIPSKGHALLLRAFADISPGFPACRLEIIGEGSERRRLVHLARDLGISERVTFHDRQSREAVAQAMRACAIFALPSSYEGLGCVYLEAMASGKPVIGCRGQGIDEVIEEGKNGFLISPGNQAELAECMRVLLLNEAFRRRIGAAARERILQRYTLEHQAGRLAQLYRECVQ